ncbi:hypothetical protein CcI49_07170 [Frankia sp. CcI49]|nr:hypothetical protein CcI49_07170 [Frankia sp. CcI49]
MDDSVAGVVVVLGGLVVGGVVGDGETGGSVAGVAVTVGWLATGETVTGLRRPPPKAPAAPRPPISVPMAVTTAAAMIRTLPGLPEPSAMISLET